jgi:Galactose oxidase, central domain
MHRTLRLVALPLFGVLLLAGAMPASAGTATWKERFPSTRPPARSYASMAEDPALDGIVVFGGYGDSTYLDDTWLWSDGRWRRLFTSQKPPARANAGMTYDAPSGDLVLFGGYDGRHWLGDTWTFDGTTWHHRHPEGSPPNATGPSLFGDPVSGRADEYGGYDGQFYQLQTWRWRSDLGTWRRVFTSRSPSARSGAVAGLDAARHRVVLFGGLGDVNPYNTWTFDGNDWTLRHPAHQPPLSWGTATAYDPTLREVVAFGGGSSGGQLGDTWVWTGTDWATLAVARPPRGRARGPRSTRSSGAW